MIASDLARFVIIGALAVARRRAASSRSACCSRSPSASALADGFFYPAAGGIVPLVVESHELASANTLIGISRQASFVDRPGARRLDLRRSRVGRGLRPQRDHVPRLGRVARAARDRARSSAEPSEGTWQVDRRRHPLRRGRAVALGRHRSHVGRADGGDGAVPGARADVRLRAVRQGRRRLRAPVRLRGGRHDDRHDRLRPGQPAHDIASGRSSASSRSTTSSPSLMTLQELVRGRRGAHGRARRAHRLRDRRSGRR